MNPASQDSGRETGADRQKTRLPDGGVRGDDDRAAEAAPDDDRADRQEDLLDEGVEETFPASDPVSVKHIT